jgi:uncharacterized membrane protein (UPF0136 family)
MQTFAKIYLLIFAALTAAGGTMGYVKAGSKPSLIAGLVSGLLLAAAGFWIPSKPVVGGALGAVISLSLLARFASVYLKKGAAMPALPMIALGALGLVFSILAIVRR